MRLNKINPPLPYLRNMQLEDLPAPIDIPPLDVKMSEPATTIFYLSSSMRPLVEVPLEASPDVLLELPSSITLDSTSVDPLSAYSSVTPCDDAHVTLSSHDDESSSFAMYGGISSTSHPIFYHDDNIKIGRASCRERVSSPV